MQVIRPDNPVEYTGNFTWHSSKVSQSLDQKFQPQTEFILGDIQAEFSKNLTRNSRI